MPLLRCHQVHKSYRLGRTVLPVLRGIDLNIPRGRFVAIMGSSGSGKSTLLHVLSGLDVPHRGQVYYEGEPMFELEGYLSRITPPEWPEDIFGKIDQEAAKRGEPLYQKNCAGCHTLKKENKPEPGDPVALKYNKTYWILKLFPVDKIGTDPTDAKNFAERTLDASSIKDQLPPEYRSVANKVPGAVVIGMVLSGIEKRTYAEMNTPVEKQDEWNGYRDNLLRACSAYPARPLAGIWACAPYLHNASVPSLYQLLLPAAERDHLFYTGGAEFDPVNVGYQTTRYDSTKTQGGFKFDTSITGNSNAGHEYGVQLTKEQRMDLIEFLKTLKFPESRFETSDPEPACPK